jgi:hypothetical protein
MDVEDLLNEPLVGVEWRIEEDQGERESEDRDGGDVETAQTARVGGQNL